jgi:ketosteroid isomerase-like protein
MEALLNFFENIDASGLEKLEEYYTDDCYFRDPFNEVHNRAELYKLFKAMLKLKDLGFDIHDRIQQGDKAFITWDFRFKALGKQQCIHGGSLLTFAEDGRVKSHVDYWDAAEGVYEKIPGLGSILRLIKKAF